MIKQVILFVFLALAIINASFKQHSRYDMANAVIPAFAGNSLCYNFKNGEITASDSKHLSGLTASAVDNCRLMENYTAGKSVFRMVDRGSPDGYAEAKAGAGFFLSAGSIFRNMSN